MAQTAEITERHKYGAVTEQQQWEQQQLEMLGFSASTLLISFA
jgi:hypothetical protein